jgi:plastin-3
MRAYTLSVLSQLASSGDPIVESAIIEWANEKLTNAEKGSRVRNFQESSISNGIVIIDLIDAIKPGIINYEVVKSGGNEEVTDGFLKITYCFGMKGNP